MAMRITSTLPNFAGLELMSKQDWFALGGYALERIKARTRRGLDVNGSPFLAYSEGYEQARREYGRPVSPVDLWVSGDMLSNFRVIETTKTSVTLGWTR